MAIIALQQAFHSAALPGISLETAISVLVAWVRSGDAELIGFGPSSPGHAPDVPRRLCEPDDKKMFINFLSR